MEKFFLKSMCCYLVFNMSSAYTILQVRRDTNVLIHELPGRAREKHGAGSVYDTNAVADSMVYCSIWMECFKFSISILTYLYSIQADITNHSVDVICFCSDCSIEIT